MATSIGQATPGGAETALTSDPPFYNCLAYSNIDLWHKESQIHSAPTAIPPNDQPLSRIELCRRISLFHFAVVSSRLIVNHLDDNSIGIFRFDVIRDQKFLFIQFNFSVWFIDYLLSSSISLLYFSLSSQLSWDIFSSRFAAREGRST